MKTVLIIAQNTFKEMIRDKILFVLLFFGLGMIIFSLLLSNLGNNEKLKLAIDFGIGAVHLTTIILAVFAGSTLIFREVDKKTILFVMSYPISKTQFWFGKFFGFSAMLAVILAGLSIALTMLMFALGWKFHTSFLIATLGIYLEALILLSVTLMFGVLVRPVIAIGCTIGIFFIGHGMNSFFEIAQRSGKERLQQVAEIIMWSLPNLEHMNWMNFVSYSEFVGAEFIYKTILYASGWVLLFSITAVLIFRRRDFV